MLSVCVCVIVKDPPLFSLAKTCVPDVFRLVVQGPIRCMGVKGCWLGSGGYACMIGRACQNKAHPAHLTGTASSVGGFGGAFALLFFVCVVAFVM